jgi:hypothetical protein
VARVDAIGGARVLEPALPRIAAGHELHCVVVQQPVVHEIGGLPDGRVALHQLRVGDRGHRHAEEAIGAVARIVPAAQVDLHAGSILAQIQAAHERRRIERARIDHLARGKDAQLDLRLALREIGEARHQPARGEHRRRGDVQLGFGGAFAHQFHRGGEGTETFAQARQAGARRLGEVHPATGAPEQLHAEVFLEALDLVADRGLRDGKLVRRLLERQVARRGLEYAQCIQRR